MVVVAGTRVNLITDYGLVTKDAATAFFNDARKAMITGVDAAGHPVALKGVDDAARLAQARLIQNVKILFFKLSKSLAPTHEKTLLIKMKGMGEDGTFLLYHIIADTQSTASTASRNALNAIMSINFKDNGWDISRLHLSFDSLNSLRGSVMT